MEIFCLQCNEPICDADESRHIGFQVQEAGGVYKNAFFFTGKADPLYFCSDKCKVEYYEANVPKKPEVSAALEELKSEIPEMAKQTSKAIEKFQNKLLTLQKKNRRNGN